MTNSRRSSVSRRQPSVGHVLTPVLLLACLLLIPRPAGAALTEGPRLAAVYDTILAAQFDEAEAQIRQACPPAPEAACKALRAISACWQILVDPSNHALDTVLTDRAADAISVSTAWTVREPARAEGWFYLAGSYAPLVALHGLRGRRLPAARNGKRIKDALEQALALDPQLDDAYFGIGLYHYYADVAPAGAKILRWLLLLPGGDRAQGLREMLRARERGQFMTGEADYQLHQVYLWYEHDPAEALRLLQRLDARYPSNPLFLQRVAEVRSDYLHDHAASAAAWALLLARARDGRVYMAMRVAERAALALARERGVAGPAAVR